MALLHLTNEARLRKNVVQKLYRSHKMKVYKSFDERSSNSGRVGFAEGSVQQRDTLLFTPTTDRQCSCIAIFPVINSLFKDIKSFGILRTYFVY